VAHGDVEMISRGERRLVVHASAQHFLRKLVVKGLAPREAAANHVALEVFAEEVLVAQ
jgi:hypothetical protein